MTEYTSAGAEFDDQRIYRYRLHRFWNERGSIPRTVLWIMLNPSTADETVLDPTLRRCEGYTREWGYDGFTVCNLFALRSTDPKALLHHPDPVGPMNDRMIAAAVSHANLVVCGWGIHGDLLDRDMAVERILRAAVVQPFCLGLTKHGQPLHPLYLRKGLKPEVIYKLRPRPFHV